MFKGIFKTGLKKLKRILFTSFDGIPNEGQGGPNNIIYKILTSLDREKFSSSFLSYKNYYKNIPGDFLNDVKPDFKKRMTDFLYYNSYLYRKITSAPSYLEKHFKTRDDYFFTYAEEKFDIIHSHDTLSCFYFANNKDSLRILTIHGNGSIENDWADAAKKNSFVKSYMHELRRREINAFNSADIITFPGSYARDLFLDDYKGQLRNDKDIRVVNNGISREEIALIKPGAVLSAANRSSAGHDIVLLNIANHVRQKNIELLISVIYELVKKGKNPLLINAGVGPLTDELKALVKKHKLNRNVKFAGKLQHKEIIGLMKISDALIMLSERVIFDLVMLEATAAGIPVISDTSGGNEEILSGYENLLKIDRKDSIHISELILRDFYHSRKYFKSDNYDFKFTLKKMMNGYEEIYKTRK